MFSCKNTHPCPHLLSRLLLLQQHLPGHRHHGHHANGPAFTTVGHRTMRSSAPWDHMKERTQRGSIMQWFTGVLSNQQFQLLLFQIFLFQIYGMGKMFATMPLPAVWQQTWCYLCCLLIWIWCAFERNSIIFTIFALHDTSQWGCLDTDKWAWYS